MATMLLHNFIITENLLDNDNDSYCEYEEIGQGVPINNYNVHNINDLVDFGNCVQQRNILAQYLASPAGAVPWQNKYI